MTDNTAILAELTRLQALFQLRAIAAHLGLNPSRLTQPDQHEPHDEAELAGAVVGEAGINHSLGDTSS